MGSMSDRRFRRLGTPVVPVKGGDSPAALQAFAATFLEKFLPWLAHRWETLRRRGPSRLPWSVSLEFVSTGQIKAQKKQFFGKAVVTDILSFPSPGVFHKQGHLGTCLICLPVVKRQAATFQHSVQEELVILLVHGVLHLLGYDHERGPRAAQVMRRWENRLLGELSWGEAKPHRRLVGRSMEKLTGSLMEGLIERSQAALSSDQVPRG